jgi:hypothetical protein
MTHMYMCSITSTGYNTDARYCTGLLKCTWRFLLLPFVIIY